MKSGKQVGRDATIGYSAAYGLNTSEIPVTRILAVHGLEHSIGPRLHRQMHMIAYIVMRGHSFYYIIAHILGMAGGEPYSHLGHGFGHKSEKSGKVYQPAVGTSIAV